jgi:hypothetical protein
MKMQKGSYKKTIEKFLLSQSVKTLEYGMELRTIAERGIKSVFRVLPQRFQAIFYEIRANERGDVPGWVLVVLMTTALVTAIWTIAQPRLSTILRNSLDSMNNVR